MIWTISLHYDLLFKKRFLGEDNLQGEIKNRDTPSEKGIRGKVSVPFKKNEKIIDLEHKFALWFVIQKEIS